MPLKSNFKSPKLSIGLFIWRLLWLIGIPVILAYLWWRSRSDPLYFYHLNERFGRHAFRNKPHVWIHAVSLGELRSAEPLIRSFLTENRAVVTTHLTPAGRRASQQLFAEEIATGQLSTVWMPFDYGLAYSRFFKAFQPCFGLVMEVEIWPGMISAAVKHHIPLFLCNGQYPTRSFVKDKHKIWSRRDLVEGFSGVMVKNEVQAQQFVELGQTNVAITGEMRFQQSIPLAQLAKALEYKLGFSNRPIITFTSVVAGEDTVFIDAIKKSGHRAIYVPRAPERFETSFNLLQSAGLRVIRRSELLSLDLNGPRDWTENWDVLLGDSMGEMTFYLALGDRAVVGGGFVAKGSHNIIEPLALGKHVIVGPHIWTIEFPVHEAIACGVAKKVSAEELPKALSSPIENLSVDEFLAKHGGSVAKTQAALRQFGVMP